MARPKLALYLGWSCGLLGIVTAGFASAASGVFLVAGGSALVLAMRLGAPEVYNGYNGARPLNAAQLRFVAGLGCLIGVVWIVLGVAEVAGPA